MPEFSKNLASWNAGFLKLLLDGYLGSLLQVRPSFRHVASNTIQTVAKKFTIAYNNFLCFDAFLIWDDLGCRDIESIMFFWTIKWVLVWTGIILSSILWCWWPAAGFPYLGPPFERPALCVCIFLLIGMRLCKLFFVVNAVSCQCASGIRLEAVGIGVKKKCRSDATKIFFLD